MHFFRDYPLKVVWTSGSCEKDPFDTLHAMTADQQQSSRPSAQFAENLAFQIHKVGHGSITANEPYV